MSKPARQCDRVGRLPAGLLVMLALVAPGIGVAQGARIDQPVTASAAGRPPPRLRGGSPASSAADRAREPAGRPAPAATAQRPSLGEVDEELAAARREYEAAFSRYTTLVTTGGEGDVERARERYRQSYERLQALKQERGIE